MTNCRTYADRFLVVLYTAVCLFATSPVDPLTLSAAVSVLLVPSIVSLLRVSWTPQGLASLRVGSVHEPPARPEDCLAALGAGEPDTRVQIAVNQIDHQAGERVERGEEEDDPLNEREIAGLDGADRQDAIVHLADRAASRHDPQLGELRVLRYCSARGV